MEPLEILDRVRNAVDLQKTIAVSLSSPCSWTALVACGIEGDSLVLKLPGSFPAIAHNDCVRVSFTVESEQSEIHGNGIARTVQDNAASIRVVLYRIIFIGRGSAPVVIERRQDAWRIAQSRPATPTRFGFWLRAVRAVSFPLSLFPVLIGTGCALIQGPVDWTLLLLAVIGGVAAHAATNLFSDYSDFVKGVDTTNALSSHTGVLVDERAEPDTILMAAAACCLATAFVGGILVVVCGWPVLLFGIAGILGGFLYTGGPRGFKYKGLGEAATGFLMGPLMVCGAFFVQTRTLSAPVILVSLAIGLLVSAVSFGNNIRDAFFDLQAGIATMPVRIGESFTLPLLRTMLVLPYVLVGCALCCDRRLLPFAAVLLSLPWTISLALRFGHGGTRLAALSEQAKQCILPLRVIRIHTIFCALVLLGCVASYCLSLFRMWKWR